tara:strand:+ start:23847 stop:24104 length:258 start_codon:yes stop_codon:yes gene_type:complete
MDEEEELLLTPIEQAQAILGEHFENYLIVASSKPHECDVEYNNSFAAIGLCDIAQKVITEGLLPSAENEVDIVWDDDIDEEEDFM